MRDDIERSAYMSIGVGIGSESFAKGAFVFLFMALTYYVLHRLFGLIFPASKGV